MNSWPDQNIVGSDGIGDTPYIIDDNNIDHYPLMVPWTLELLKTDLNDDEVINILDITLAASAFGTIYNETDGMHWHSPPCDNCPHDPICDVNKDDVVNILDLATIALDYGKTV